MWLDASHNIDADNAALNLEGDIEIKNERGIDGMQVTKTTAIARLSSFEAEVWGPPDAET